MDGTMLKKKIKDKETGEVYEPNGHLTDTFKDLVVSMFNPEFVRFQNRFKTISAGQVVNKIKPKINF